MTKAPHSRAKTSAKVKPAPLTRPVGASAATAAADDGPVTPAEGRFHEAVLALVSERTIKAAAKRVGIHERTMRKWLERKDFADAVRVARRRQLAQAATELSASAPTFIATLVDVAKNGESEAARVAASRAGLELAGGFVGLDEMAEELAKKLEDVEARLAERSKA